MFINTKEFNEYFNNKKTVVEKWQQANEGDWVLASDGGVVQILKKGSVKHPQDRKNYKYAKHYVRTVVGTFLCVDSVYMDTDFSQHKKTLMVINTRGQYLQRKKRYLQLMLQLVWELLKAIWMRLVKQTRIGQKRKQLYC